MFLSEQLIHAFTDTFWQEPLYLPPRCELDAHLFRLVDGTKRRVWFEWAADVYLPLPAHTMAPSPTHASSVNTTTSAATSNGALVSRRQRASSPMDSRSTSQMSAHMSPVLDTAGLPIPSPYIGNDSLSSTGFMMDLQRTHSMEGIIRLKIGQTRLHNPAGRSSWVGL
jgi:protein arginine N-methyltransferase 5